VTKLRISPDLALPADVVTSTSVVFGGKGMGKTNLASVIVEEAAKAGLRWCFLDPMGVAWGLRHSKDGKGPGVECVILGGIHGDIPIEPTSGDIVADLVVDEHVNVIIDFSRNAGGVPWSKGEKIKFVTAYINRLFRRQGEIVGGRRREPVLQIVDEAARYVPQVIPHGSPELAACVGAFEQAAEEGRNIGLGIAFLTQRSARINKSVSELADVMFAFRTVGPNSVDAIVDWLGEHMEKARARELAGKIRELDVGQCLVISPGWLKISDRVVKIRERETCDSSATPKPGEQAKRVTGEAAKPDLGKYRERMAQTIERAKADDPKELRKEIAALKKQVATKPTTTTTTEKPVVDQRAIDRAVAVATRSHASTIHALRDALDLAMKFIINITARNFDVAGVDKGDIERAVQSAMAKATELVDRKLTARQKEIDELRKEAQRIADRLKRVASAKPEDVVIDVSVARNQPFSVDAHSSGNSSGNGNGKPPRSAGAPRLPREPIVPSGDLKLGHQKILNALAELEAIGVEKPGRAQLGMFAGYNLTGGSGGQYIADLNTLGLLELPDKGAVRLTDAGRASAAPADPPGSLDELHDRMLAKLSDGQRKILEHLISIYPESISRADLGEATEYNLTGGSGGQYVADLVTLGAAKLPGKGAVVASAILFPEALV
jgi:hypothetical protein